MHTSHGFVLAAACALTTVAHAAAGQFPISSSSSSSNASGSDAGMCTCGSSVEDGEPAGLLWRGLASPNAEQIAAMLAPVLWFSSKEPLLDGRDGPIPGPVPCDRPSVVPIVYYQIAGVHLMGAAQALPPIERDPELFSKARGLVVKFFFYYPWDRGLSPHRHDLEAAEVDLSLRQWTTGCREIRIRRVTGLAHGVSWYANILKAEQDMKLPLTMLIEEGKHAVCPDRNADGLYTPGYDVNARVRDAWGIRDTMASGRVLTFLSGPGLSGPRDPAFRLLPPDASLPACIAPGRRSIPSSADPESSLGQYELRSAEAVPRCPSVPNASMLSMLRRTQRFGAEHPPAQYRLPLARELKTPDAPTRFIAGLAARYDEGAPGISAMLRGYDVGPVWIVPRFGYAQQARKFSAELLITRSASRWLDPYLSVGFERADPVYDDRKLNELFASVKDPLHVPIDFYDKALKYEGRSTMVTEAGLKLRLRVPGHARWALLGYQFGGVRMGLRVNGAQELRNPRFVIEIGPGVF